MKFKYLGVVILGLALASQFAKAQKGDSRIDVENDEIDVTLFRGAANNSWFPVYFNAESEPGAEDVPVEIREVNLRPERDVTLHVEVYNPSGSIPLVITPGGNGDTNGFGGFARNVAAAAQRMDASFPGHPAK